MEKALKGKKIVLGIIIATLLLEVFITVLVYYAYAGNGHMDVATTKFIQGVIRIIIASVIFLFLYKGHKWAKWIMIILFLISFFLLLLSINESFNILSLLMIVIFGSSGFILLISKEVKEFLNNQRN